MSGRETPSGGLRLGTVHSTDELRAAAHAWDDLWLRSDVVGPRIRAELVALWVDHFCKGAPFRALTVAADGKLVAALPLVEMRWRGLITVGALTGNDWARNGDLLLDPATDVSSVLDLLVSGFAELPWSYITLSPVPLTQPRWCALQEAFVRAALSVGNNILFHVGQIHLGNDWEAYLASRPRKHRQNCRRLARRIELAGGARVRVYAQPEPQDLAKLLMLGFEIEDRSWKGDAGTSVLRVPGMLKYFRREARQLAQWGQLELVFLEHAERPIAFFYASKAKGTYWTSKLAYDPAFRKLGPGQQTMMQLLQRLHADPASDLLDLDGPLVEWSRSWATRVYPMGRLAIGPRGLSGRLFTALACNWYPRLRAFRLFR